MQPQVLRLFLHFVKSSLRMTLISFWGERRREELTVEVSHPCDKSNYVARMGRPIVVGQLVCESVLIVEAFDAEELSARAQLFFDAEELVVLGDAVGAADRAGLDLAYACGYGEVGDEGVFRLA
jgi:hypothetical protein